MDVKKSLTQLGIKLQLLDRPEQLQMWALTERFVPKENRIIQRTLRRKAISSATDRQTDTLSQLECFGGWNCINQPKSPE
jgi:hypothetical protein